MSTDTTINLITSIGTVGAVVVALGVTIIPAIWRSHKNRKYAEKRIFLALDLIAKSIKEYRFYNPTHFVITEGKIHYSYSPDSIKIDVSIDIAKEVEDIIEYIDSLNKDDRLLVWQVTKDIKLFASGFPREKAEWDELEVKISSLLELLEKRINS